MPGAGKTPSRRLALQGLGGLPLVFANYVQVYGSQYNFELDFGQIGPASGDPGERDAIASAICRIAIPVQVLPALIRALTANKARYEAVFGPIADVEIAAQEAATGEDDRP